MGSVRGGRAAKGATIQSIDNRVAESLAKRIAPKREMATSGLQPEGFVVMRHRKALILVALALLVTISFMFSLALGRYNMDLGRVLALLASPVIGAAPGQAADANVFFTIRFPRVFAALIVGAALSGAGCAFQGVFKNPMASPDLLGASAGACFGAALGILVSFCSVGMELAAFAFGVVAVLVSYALSSAISKRMGGVLVLVLSGLVVGNLFQAFTSAIKFLADPNSQLPEITFWLIRIPSFLK